MLLRGSVLEHAGLDVGSSFDGVVAGRQVRFHVVGEVTAVDFGGILDWSTLAAADPDAEPERYVVQPGSDADAYAAAVQAEEPDFLTVTPNSDVGESTRNTIKTLNALMSVLGLIARRRAYSQPCCFTSASAHATLPSSRRSG